MSIIEQEVELCEPTTDACIRFKALFDSGATETLVREALIREQLPQAKITDTGKMIPRLLADGSVEMIPERYVQLRLSFGRGCRTPVRTIKVIEKLSAHAIIGASEMEAIEMALRFSDGDGSRADCLQSIVTPSYMLGEAKSR